MFRQAQVLLDPAVGACEGIAEAASGDAKKLALDTVAAPASKRTAGEHSA